MQARRITLLTDFGTADGYAGAMKGVIASIVPDAFIDDISHDIAPGDIGGAAWCVERYWREYPAGTVHVCVVDPGVGSERRCVIGVAEGRILIGPDNGVFSVPFAVPGASVFQIVERTFMRDVVSATFHGRDVFAVAAARVATGIRPEDAGPRIEPVLLPRLHVARTADGVAGCVVHADRFGNLITNVPAALMPPRAHVRCDDSADAVRVVRTYAEADPGELVALIGSGGMLELAVRDGSAADRLRRGVGLAVEIIPEK